MDWKSTLMPGTCTVVHKIELQFYYNVSLLLDVLR